MDRAPVNGIELEYEVRGTGEPVVLMHAGVCADFFAPLLGQPALARYSVLRYHRAGYAGSGRLAGPVGFSEAAAHCRALMDHLGIERAHVVGHSSSASMALQLALDEPEAVQSLALLDPARPTEPTPAHQEMVRTVVAPGSRALRRRRQAGSGRHLDARRLRRRLPRRARAGASARVRPGGGRCGHLLRAGAAGRAEWSFGRDEAARITQPALAVVGENSQAFFRERRDLLVEWLPNVEAFELPEATHLLQVENPGGMAEALDAFFARHPMP